MKISAKYGVPVIPFGGGTSMEAQVNAIYGGITLDMRQMNKILNISVEDLQATVEGGVTRLQLNQALEEYGLHVFHRSGRGRDARRHGLDARLRHHGRALWHDARERPGAQGRARRWACDQDRLARAQVRSRLRSHAALRRRRGHARRDDRSHTAAAPAAGSCRRRELHVRRRSAMRSKPRWRRSSSASPWRASSLWTKLQVEACNRYSKTNYPVAPILFFEFHGDSGAQCRRAGRNGEEARGRASRARISVVHDARRARRALENAPRGVFRECGVSQGREDVYDGHLRADLAPRGLHRRIEKGYPARVVSRADCGACGRRQLSYVVYDRPQ